MKAGLKQQMLRTSSSLIVLGVADFRPLVGDLETLCKMQCFHPLYTNLAFVRPYVLPYDTTL